MALEVGRVCVKTSGRESGRYCVVLKKLAGGKKSGSFVLVTGPRLLSGVKRKRSNIMHLKPTEHMLEIKEDATDEEVITAYDKAGLVTKLNLKRPSAAEMKAEKAKIEKLTKEKPVVEKQRIKTEDEKEKTEVK